MTVSKPRSIVGVLALTGIAIAIAYLWIDRPFALWSHEHLNQYQIFDRMTLLTGWFPPIAVVVICSAGLAKLIVQRDNQDENAPLLGCRREGVARPEAP
jgi:hypothetical protein